MPTMRLNGLELSFQRAGNGPTLLLLHGIIGGQAGFDDLTAALTSKLSVLRYSQPGMDGSEPFSEPVTIDRLADHCVAVMDAFELAQVVLMGVSYGGWIAQAVARRYPQRLSALVLACSYSATLAHRIPPPPDPELARLFAPDVPSAERARLSFEQMFHQRFREAHPEFLKQIEQELAQQALDGALLQQRVMAAGSFNLEPPVLTQALPALAIGGRDDRIVPHENQAVLHQDLPSTEVITLPETGHCFFREVPIATAERILSWLNTQGIIA